VCNNFVLAHKKNVVHIVLCIHRKFIQTNSFIDSCLCNWTTFVLCSHVCVQI